MTVGQQCCIRSYTTVHTDLVLRCYNHKSPAPMAFRDSAYYSTGRSHDSTSRYVTLLPLAPSFILTLLHHTCTQHRMHYSVRSSTAQAGRALRPAFQIAKDSPHKGDIYTHVHIASKGSPPLALSAIPHRSPMLKTIKYKHTSPQRQDCINEQGQRMCATPAITQRHSIQTRSSGL